MDMDNPPDLSPFFPYAGYGPADAFIIDGIDHVIVVSGGFFFSELTANR